MRLLISRAKASIPYVVDLVESLDVPEAYINTWKKGVAPSDRDCHHCGKKDGLNYREGCLTCRSCGFSECG